MSFTRGPEGARLFISREFEHLFMVTPHDLQYSYIRLLIHRPNSPQNDIVDWHMKSIYIHFELTHLEIFLCLRPKMRPDIIGCVNYISTEVNIFINIAACVMNWNSNCGKINEL